MDEQQERGLFMLFVKKVHSHISGRGVLVTGEVDQGTIKTGDKLELLTDSECIGTKCIGLEASGTPIEEATVQEGREIEVWLENLSTHQVHPDDAIATPGMAEPM